MAKRYAQVAEKLAAEIALGNYPVGSTLPSEPVLAEQLGISRSTLRAALGELHGLGMVSRRPGAGTRVETMRPRNRGEGFFQTLESIDEIVQYAANTLRDQLSFEDVVADGDLATQTGLEPGSKLLKISYRRIDRENPASPPICWTDVYVRSEYADHVRTLLPNHRGAVSELIERGAGRPIIHVEQILRACGVPEHQAEQLTAKANDHALEITRRYYWGKNEISLVSISIHPGNRFSYASRLSRHR